MPWASQIRDTYDDESVIIEAIGVHDMQFWFVFLGCLGLMNDINVMGGSTLSMAYMESASKTKSTMWDIAFEGNFLSTYGICPNYAYLTKTVSHPSNPKDKFFAKH